MSFNPDSVINQATSGGSIYSPGSGVAGAGYGNGINWGVAPVQNLNSSSYSGNYGVYGTSQPQQQSSSSSPINFSSFNPSSLGSNSSYFSGLTHDISNSINNFGADYLGFGSGGLPAIPSGLSAADTGFLSAAQTASGASAESVAGSLSTGSLTSVLGGAAFGAGIGSLLNSKNQTAGMIGGALGGAIGAATGITSGITMGATLGSVVPGLGTVIGAVVGGLGSRLFGSKSPPTNADAFFTQVNADGSTSNPNYTSKNAQQTAGFAANQNMNLTKMAQAVSKDLGIDFSGLGFGGGISTKHPGPGGSARIYVDAYDSSGTNHTIGGTENNFYNPDDTKSSQGAYLAALKAAAVQKGYTDTSKIDQWFTNYTTRGSGISAPPVGGSAGTPPPREPSQFDQFLANYKAQQNANAAP